MTVRMVGEKLAREAGRRSASVEVDERKLAGAGAAAAIQAVREQTASMSDVLEELEHGLNSRWEQSFLSFLAKKARFVTTSNLSCKVVT